MASKLTPAERQKIAEYLAAQPAKRGIDIPAETWDAIWHVANGITQPLWGRSPTPQQIDHLYRTGAHTPEAIHQAYGELPHPHAPNVKVGEFQDHAHALELYEQSQPRRRRR